MSVPVALAELGEALRRYGFAYLLTHADRGGPRVVAVQPQLLDDVLTVTGVGRRTADNAAARPEVTLVWPPREDGGYSLIVDGRAEPTDDGLRVRPERAVLHRPAPAPEGGAGSCGADCVELPVTPSPSRQL